MKNTDSEDQLVRKYTGFEDMEELLNAKGGYYPSFQVDNSEIDQLANIYDAYQYARGDTRRALRT